MPGIDQLIKEIEESAKQKKPMDIKHRFKNNEEVDQFVAALTQYVPTVSTLLVSCQNEEAARYFADKLKEYLIKFAQQQQNLKHNITIRPLSYLTKEYFHTQSDCNTTLAFEEDVPVLVDALHSKSVKLSSLSLSGSDAGAEKKFLEQLSKKSIEAQIGELTISGMHFSQNEWGNFLKTIATPEIGKIRLVISQKEDIEAIVKALQNKSLDLSNLSLVINSQDQSAANVLQQEMANALLKNPIEAKITSLHIEGLQFTHNGWSKFLLALGKNTALKNVTMQGTNFNYTEDVSALAALIKSNSSITELRLYSQLKEERGSEAYKHGQEANIIAEALQNNKTLEVFKYGDLYALRDENLRADICKKLSENEGGKARAKELKEYAKLVTDAEWLKGAQNNFFKDIKTFYADDNIKWRTPNTILFKLNAFYLICKGVIDEKTLITSEQEDTLLQMYAYFKGQYDLLLFAHEHKSDKNPALKKLAEDINLNWSLFTKQEHKNFAEEQQTLFREFHELCETAQKEVPASDKETHATLKNVLLAIASVLTASIALWIYLAVTTTSRRETGYTFFSNDVVKPNPTADKIDELDKSADAVLKYKGPQ